MRSPYCMCMSFKLLTQVTDFNEMWYEFYAIRSHQYGIIVYLVQSVGT
jgi:hypothetical protein